MSTKSTVAYENDTHVYEECFDDGVVQPLYVEQRNKCECGQYHGSSEVCLSPVTRIKIATSTIAQVRHYQALSERTDAAIEADIRSRVECSAKYAAQNPARGTAGSLLAWCSWGDPLTEFENCIKVGIAEAKKHRAEVIEQIEAMRKLLAENEAAGAWDVLNAAASTEKDAKQ